MQGMGFHNGRMNRERQDANFNSPTHYLEQVMRFEVLITFTTM
jgi:hypothetical protein